MSAVRDYKAEPYPLAPETEAAMQREERGHAARERARKLRDFSVLARSALDGAHGATAQALAREGLTPEQRAHVTALARWEDASNAVRKLTPDEGRAVKAALDAWGFEHTLATVVREIRKEIAVQSPPKGPRR